MSDHRERLGPGRRSLLAAGAITVAVACLAVAGCSATSVVTGSPPANGAPHVGGLLSGLGASSTKIVPPAPAGPPADPFTGTPADHWADGATGIVLPAATAVGSYTKKQVGYAYQMTRQLLIAAGLDKQTLMGGAPTAFADLLAGSEKVWFEQNLNKTGVTKTGASASSRVLVLSFPPGSTQLIGSVIKVNGTMHAKAGRLNGNPALDIDVDYLFVYPIEPPHQPGQWMRIVYEAAWTVYFGNWQGSASSFTPWVSTPGGNKGGVAGADCGTADGYAHPDYPRNSTASPQPSVSPSGAPQNPYIAGQSRVQGCQASTGT
jgi:hypothetical protein